MSAIGTTGYGPDPEKRGEDGWVCQAEATPPELAAWEVAVERGLNTTRADIRALLEAAGGVITEDQGDADDSRVTVSREDLRAYLDATMGGDPNLRELWERLAAAVGVE